MLIIPVKCPIDKRIDSPHVPPPVTQGLANSRAPPVEESKDEENAKEMETSEYASVSYEDIFRQFVLLGWTAFGGPAAHIGASLALLMTDNCSCV